MSNETKHALQAAALGLLTLGGALLYAAMITGRV
jgi:hypothetical protein